MGVSTLEGVVVICAWGWLLGVGLLAHAVVSWLNSGEAPEFVRTGIAMFTERVALVLALVIVGWPLTIPVLLAVKKMKER